MSKEKRLSPSLRTHRRRELAKIRREGPQNSVWFRIEGIFKLEASPEERQLFGQHSILLKEFVTIRGIDSLEERLRRIAEFSQRHGELLDKLEPVLKRVLKISEKEKRPSLS